LRPEPATESQCDNQVGGLPFAGRLLKRIGLEAAPDLAEMARGYASLGDG
jgi:hypothetical protein